MMRVISSPSSSTIGFFTLILVTGLRSLGARTLPPDRQVGLAATMSAVFGGGGSIQLARVFGIRIGVDVSWFFILFLIIWSLSGFYQDVFPGDDSKAFLLAVVSALLFFVSILLHELGHAVVAIRNGIPILGIDLWLFGGVARMQRDTDSAGVEFRVAAAGPLVTLVIAVLCYLAAIAISSPEAAWDAATFQAAPLNEATAVLGYLAFINAITLLFNLVPGFPLDGGRIVRAIAWWRTGDRNRATRFAARLGRAAGWVMVGVGILEFFSGSLIWGVWLGFIGFSLAQTARAAEAGAALSTRIETIRIADVMDAEPVAVPENMGIDRVLSDYFLRYGWPWFPVVDPDGRLVGVVTREAVEGVEESDRPVTPVAAVMARDDAESSLRVGLEEPLEAALGREGLSRLGAIMAVDGDGMLRGIVTVDQVRRALQGATAQPG
jgi:Zn-dependent protease